MRFAVSGSAMARRLRYSPEESGAGTRLRAGCTAARENSMEQSSPSVRPSTATLMEGVWLARMV